MLELRVFLALLLWLPVFALHAQNSGAQVEAIINREMAARRIPGLQLAVMHHGQLVLSRCYGLANLQDSIRVDHRTIFPINSCTKVFTSVAIMQLVEAGKLTLSAPAATYLDSLPEPWRLVTVRQLLTHTSGLPDLLKLLDANTGGLAGLKNERTAWDKLQRQPLEFAPGTRFSYNQTNAYLLGKIIEKAYHKPFAEVFAEKQLRPVGMPRTLFGDSRDVIPHFAPTYFYRTGLDGRPLPQETLVNNYYEFPYFRRTAAGLNSTAEDMVRWLIALQAGRLLASQATRDTMWTPAKFTNGQPTPWALGWGIAKNRPQHRALGMSGGGRAAFLLYPDDDLAVVILTNLGGSFPEDFLEEIASCYEPGIISADPLTFLRVHLRDAGFAQAIPLTKKQIKKDPSFRPQEFELNEWAYRLLAKNQLPEAVEIFKLAVYLFPASWNAYDSYGEALAKAGRRPEAIKAYEQSVHLNADNEHGKKMLAQLAGH
ncbi:serine hydrolase domain-containing protein [Hymenobacter negativus]|uniref:Serine hydrolase n=1 Tax=Hymenobacter negativus TaxID=2795026 RepID=A0ABS3QLT4_9BACT|nr:serine hydrolase domain-containing protein [Hymenobacter negativus]MBO2012097.1 serine hydrolase [Hymenobacter negativus]